MKRSWQRLCTVLLTIAMLLSLFPATTLATQEGDPAQDVSLPVEEPEVPPEEEPEVPPEEEPEVPPEEELEVPPEEEPEVPPEEEPEVPPEEELEAPPEEEPEELPEEAAVQPFSLGTAYVEGRAAAYTYELDTDGVDVGATYAIYSTTAEPRILYYGGSGTASDCVTGTKSGSQLSLDSSYDSARQLWVVEDAGNGKYALKSATGTGSPYLDLSRESPNKVYTTASAAALSIEHTGNGLYTISGDTYKLNHISKGQFKADTDGGQVYLFKQTQPQAAAELTIPGYTRVEALPAGGLESGRYLIVAPSNGKYYVLYPGATGAAQAADNVRELVLDGQLNATGWKDKNGTEDTTHPFSAADNNITYDAATGKHAVVAAGPGYPLICKVHAEIYQTSGSSELTVTASEGLFRFMGGSYLLYYATNANFNQASSLSSSAYYSDMMLFKREGEVEPEPTPQPVALADILPGYTLYTGDADLPESNYYIIVTQSTDGTYYALYATDTGKTIGSGSLSATNAGACAVQLEPVSNGGTVTTTAKYLLNNTAVDIAKLQFAVEKSGDSFLFTSNGVGLAVGNKLFADSAAALTVATDTSNGRSNAYSIAAANRALDFNKVGDSASAYPNHITDFWGPGIGGHFPLYFFYKADAPTVWQNLQTLISQGEELQEEEYTRATWGAFAAALAAAKALGADSAADDIKGARTALRDAMEALQRAPVVPELEGARLYTQVSSSSLAEGTYAILSNESSGNRILYHLSGSGNTDRVTGEPGSETINGAAYVTLTFNGLNPIAQKWELKKVSGGYTLRSVASGYYLNPAKATAAGIAVSESPVTITITQSSSGVYTVKSGSNGLTYNSGNFSATANPSGVRLFKETVFPLSEEQVVRDWHELVPTPGTTAGQPFPKGTAGSNNFRIPAICTLSDGTLVAAIDARWGHTLDACGLDTIFSYSTDNGATWHYSFPNYFGDSANGLNSSQAQYASAIIDPVMAVGKDDSIYILADVFPGGVAINTAPMRPASVTGFVRIGGRQRLVLYTTGVSSEQTDDNYSYYIGDYTDGYAPVMELIPGGEDEATRFYVDERFYLYAKDTPAAAADYENDKIFCPQIGSGKVVQQNVFFYNAILHVRNVTYLWLLKGKLNPATGALSWETPRLLNDQVGADPDGVVVPFYGAGPGNGLCLDDGTIVLPGYKWNYSNASQHASLIYSSDGGETWKRTADVGPSSHWTSESAVTQVDAGTLRHFVRDSTATLWYADYTWDADRQEWVVGTLVDTRVQKRGSNGCQLAAITYSEEIDGKTALIVSTPASTSGRDNGKLYVFLVDDSQPGKPMSLAYTYQVTAAGSPYAYSSLSETRQGDIALLYEDAAVTFKVLPMADIVPTAETVEDYSGEYDGLPHTINITGVTGGASVEYSDDGSTWSDTAPTYTDAGSYTVYYRLKKDGCPGLETAVHTQSVTIRPAASGPAISLTADTPVLTGSGRVTLTASGLPERIDGDSLTLRCDRDGDVLTLTGPDASGFYTAAIDLTAPVQQPEEHRYTLTYTSSNYRDALTATTVVTVHPPVPELTVTARGYNGPYDGNPHTITVDSAQDVTVTYCETPDGTYTTTAPTRTNAGSTVVYYRATKGDKVIAGSATVLISKINPAMALTPSAHHWVWDEEGLSLTITGVPAADQGSFTLSVSEDRVQRITSADVGNTRTFTATPVLPKEVRTYTFVGVFEPAEQSNYNRFVRTCVVAVTVAAPSPLAFDFAPSVSSSLDNPLVGSITIPFDGAAHSPEQFLSYDQRQVDVLYSTDPEEESFTDERPSFTQPGTYTVLCLGTDREGELESRLLTLSLTITDGTVRPDIQLSAQPAILAGGGKTTITVTGVPDEGPAPVLTCSDAGVILPAPNWDGTYTVTLPATVKTYTFTATYTPAPESRYEAGSGACLVSVTTGGGSSGGGGGGSSSVISQNGATNEDGSVTTTVTNHFTGSTITTIQYPNGAVRVEETAKNGAVVITDTALSGVVVRTERQPDKDVSVSVTLPDQVEEASVSVPTPINYTTVAIDAATGAVVTLSAPNKAMDAMLLKVGGSAQMVLVDRPNGFTDVGGHWAKDAIDFIAAHELFNGTSKTQFSPDADMTRAMMVTVLARFDGADTSGGGDLVRGRGPVGGEERRLRRPPSGGERLPGAAGHHALAVRRLSHHHREPERLCR